MAGKCGFMCAPAHKLFSCHTGYCPTALTPPHNWSIDLYIHVCVGMVAAWTRYSDILERLVITQDSFLRVFNSFCLMYVQKIHNSGTDLMASQHTQGPRVKTEMWSVTHKLDDRHSSTCAKTSLSLSLCLSFALSLSGTSQTNRFEGSRNQMLSCPLPNRKLPLMTSTVQNEWKDNRHPLKSAKGIKAVQKQAVYQTLFHQWALESTFHHGSFLTSQTTSIYLVKGFKYNSSFSKLQKKPCIVNMW